ncbi:MAG: hypothetical protein LBM68_01970, partial [Bacteroidales bacterium]|jgi:hypothetical protein|nr:hypothetical protein [Bacteroidales bacterium]
MDWRPGVRHAVTLVGYKTIQIGDRILIASNTEQREIIIEAGNPLIGENAWIFKNNSGTSWGENGFGYVVTDWDEISAYFITGSVTSLQYNNTDIICEDRDGDGYYFWGIGAKPETCPDCARDELDGDDSNPNLGAIDEYGNFLPMVFPPANTNQTVNATTATWNTRSIY